MSHLRILSTRNKTSVISSLIFLLLAISIRQIETESSAEAEIPLGPSCTSADEFAAPAYGHCLPMQKCTAIHSGGSNSPKFRLIIKALLCDTTDEQSIGENPKICCPDPRTNNVGGVSNTATIGDPDSTVQANIEQEVHSETKTNDNDDDEANDESGEASHETGVESTTRPNQITVVDVTKIDMGEYTAKVKEDNDDSMENDGIVHDDDKKEVELEDDGNETKTGKSQEAFTSTNDEQEVHKEDSKGDTSDISVTKHETNEKSIENSEEHQKNDETKISLVSANNEVEKGQNNEHIANENSDIAAKTHETVEKSPENPEEPQKNDETKLILDSTNDDQEKIQNNETPEPENRVAKLIETEMQNAENQEEPQKKDEAKILQDSTNYNNEEKFQNEDALKSEEIDIRSANTTESGTDKLISPIHEVDVQNDASYGVTLELEDEHNTASELQDDENDEEKSQKNFETTMSPFSDYANVNTEIPEKTLFEKDEKVENPEVSLNAEKTEIQSENTGDDGQGTEENYKSHEVVDTTTDKSADATEISGITAKLHVGDDESVESRGDPPEDEVTTMGATDFNNEPVDSNMDSNSSSDNNTESELDGEGTLTNTVTETGLYHMDGSSQVEYETAFGPTHL